MTGCSACRAPPGRPAGTGELPGQRTHSEDSGQWNSRAAMSRRWDCRERMGLASGERGATQAKRRAEARLANLVLRSRTRLAKRCLPRRSRGAASLLGAWVTPRSERATGMECHERGRIPGANLPSMGDSHKGAERGMRSMPARQGLWITAAYLVRSSRKRNFNKNSTCEGWDVTKPSK